ncbi:QcrA and Rieske domain-containing protein [Paenibacillus koleovorans]|uniref:QcrA and Rieske domain-containing protein n=1 Tax=Paenibacillus koleovorans TaxID=121608 RepID=UPI000FDACD3F|nr:Rieske 2Fe-2S domain-containing protein [Paenibacillus koleovorans]
MSTSGKLAIGAAGILLGSSGLCYYGAIQGKKQEELANATRELSGNFVKIGAFEQLNSIQGFEKIQYSAITKDAWVTNTNHGFVYVTNHENKLRILSPACSHLGCTVEPATEAQKKTKKELYFLCPCHLAEFDKAGNAVGVVDQGLYSYAPVLADGNVYIDILSPTISCQGPIRRTFL